MAWSKGYDFVHGERASERLFSASTNVRANGVQQFLLQGLSRSGSPHMDVFFEVSDGGLWVGGTRLTSGGAHVGPEVELSTDPCPLVARIEAKYDRARERYDVRFLEIPQGSGISSTAWAALERIRRSPLALPGEYGCSGTYDVRLCAPVAPPPTRSSVIAPFGPKSSIALSIDWRPFA